MKKITVLVATIILVMATSNVFASMKYSVTPEKVKFFNNVYDKEIVKNMPYSTEYLDILFNKHKLNRILMENNGRMSQDKVNFINNNQELVVKLVKIGIMSLLILKLDPVPTENQYLYVTSVIKNRKDMIGDNNAAEKKIAETFLGEMPLYKIYKEMNKDLSFKLCDALVDDMIRMKIK